MFLLQSDIIAEMSVSRILLKGPISPKDIIIRQVKTSNRKIDIEVEKKTQSIWEETLKESKEKGWNIYNGESYRLEQIGKNGNNIELKVSKLKFKTRNSLTRQSISLHKLGEDYYCKGLAIGWFLRTSDNKYIFGQRSGSSLTVTRIDFIGGILEDVNLRSGKDIIHKGLQEIKEEAGISKQNLKDISIATFVISPSTNIIVLASALVNLDSIECKSIFEKERLEDEMSNLVFVDKDKLRQFLLNLGGYKTPLVDVLDIII